MKKSLVIISFAFIFLLSLSFVSAGFWGWLTGKPTLTQINPPKDDGGPFNNFFDLFGGGETIPLPPDNGIGDLPLDGGNLGGESCETLEIEELFISPGNVGNEALNNRFIDFDDDEVLTIDETFSTQLEEGRKYLIPIPNQKCYWEASYEKGELYLTTICYPEDEPIV